MINQVYTEKYISMGVREKLWKIRKLNQVRYYEQKFLKIYLIYKPSLPMISLVRRNMNNARIKTVQPYQNNGKIGKDYKQFGFQKGPQRAILIKKRS